jgi:hypothetical protein
MVSITKNIINYLNNNNIKDISFKSSIPYITLIVAKGKGDFKTKSIDKVLNSTKEHPIDILFTPEEIKEYIAIYNERMIE